MAQLTSLSQILPNQKVLRFVYTGGFQSFVVPVGFDSTIDVYLWGGGGAGGGTDAHRGGSGAGGQFAYSQITARANDQVSVYVGGGGAPGGSGGGAPGGSGGASGVSVDSKQFTGANGGYAGPRPWSGGGGGGGGATLIAVNGIPQAVAGGGGGGGGGGCNSPGGDAPGSTNPLSGLVYPAPLWGTYPNFLSANGVWGPDRYSGSFSGQWTVTFPVSGMYYLQGTADNGFSYHIDGNPVLSGGDWGTIYTESVYVNAGNHTVSMYADNWGGPASAALVITAPSGSVVFNSISPPLGTNAYIPAQLGQSHGFDGGGGGGGAGGWPGGNGGGAGNGDNGGSWAYSGTSYNAVSAINASGQVPGNTQSPFYNSNTAHGGSPSSSGAAGYAVLVLTAKGLAKIKHAGDWKQLNGAFYKVNGQWKPIIGTWVKHNNTWVPVTGSEVSVSGVNSSGFSSSQTGNRGH